MRKFYFLVSLLYFLSCKTIPQHPAQEIAIHAEKGLRIISVSRIDSTNTDFKNFGSRFFVTRSTRPLVIKIQGADSGRIILLPAGRKLAAKVWPQIQAYPGKTYITKQDTGLQLRSFPLIKMGTLRFSIAHNFVNGFSLHTGYGQFNSVGFMEGLEVGFDYFHHNNRYYSFLLGVGSSDSPVDYVGTGFLKSGNTVYLSFRDNVMKGKFDLGYGMGVSYMNYQRTSYYTPDSNYAEKSMAFGGSFSAQFRLTPAFRIGLLYQPSLIDLSGAPLINYQHYFSINLIVKIGGRKMSRKQYN